jgi:hypothetical protein
MFPRLTRTDPRDGCLGNTVLGCKFDPTTEIAWCCSYLAHLLRCKFGIGDLLTNSAGLPWKSILAERILSIIRVCAKPQMVRIHASSIIPTRAIMANQQPFRNRTAVEFPTVAMRGNIPTMDRIEMAITIPSTASQPQPTAMRRLGFINLRPKALYNVHADASYQVLAAPRPLVAARGFTVGSIIPRMEVRYGV